MPNEISVRAALWWLATETWRAVAVWRGPEAARGRAARQRAVDIALVLLAGTLPWSTAGSAGVIIAVVILILTTIDVGGFFASLRRGACALPLALFVLAVVGTAWAADVPGPDRLHGIDQVAKLWLIPLLFVHFRESERAAWVFATYAASNVVLLGFSFVVLYAPHLALMTRFPQAGVPVKNYIDQSQGFVLCAVALAAIAIEAGRRRMHIVAAILAALVAVFLANLAFVNIARTAFVYLPAMLLLLMLRYLNGRQFAAALASVIVLGLALWATAPNLRQKLATIFTELARFSEPVGPDGPVSVAMRLEYWQKSIAFVSAAPLIGHGTGATRALFQRGAEGRSGLDALVTANPHNQTLAVAIQWGFVGCVMLWAMWIAHLALFRGPGFAGFLGLLVVTQNILSSLFNSHLFDFYEGWLYVLVVGIAGGIVSRDADGTGPKPESAVTATH